MYEDFLNLKSQTGAFVKQSPAALSNVRIMLAIARRGFVIALLVVVSACQGAGTSRSGNLLPAPSAPQSINAHAQTGTVVLTVPILTGTPEPNGPWGLSVKTASIAGTIGSSVVKPVQVGPNSAKCSQASGMLTCTLPVRAKAGAHKVDLYAYATSDGSGPKLARGLGQVTVYAGRKNYPAYVDWNGFAKSIAVVAAPSSFTQGEATSAKLVVYGVDAAGGTMALPYARGPNGDLIGGLTVSETGPYVAAQKPSGLDFPFAFAYDGVLTGTEKVRAAAASGGVNPVTTKLKLLPGPSSNGKLFVQVGDGFGSNAGNVFQFVPAGTPNVAPLRSLLLPAVLAGPASNGSFWALKPGNSGFIELDEYDRYGNRVARIPAAYRGAKPDNLPFIGAATVDRSGNAYVVDELSGSLPKIDVYGAGCYTCAPQSSTPVGSSAIHTGSISGVKPFIAVDGSGNAYVAEYTSINDTIYEYAPGSSSPLQTITTSYLQSMAADASDNLYVMSAPSSAFTNMELVEYPPGGPTKVLLADSLPNTSLVGVATGPDGTVYAGVDYRAVGADPYSFQVETLKPPSSTWTLLIGGTATGLPKDQISATIVVP